MVVGGQKKILSTLFVNDYQNTQNEFTWQIIYITQNSISVGGTQVRFKKDGVSREVGHLKRTVVLGINKIN